VRRTRPAPRRRKFSYHAASIPITTPHSPHDPHPVAGGARPILPQSRNGSVATPAIPVRTRLSSSVSGCCEPGTGSELADLVPGARFPFWVRARGPRHASAKTHEASTLRRRPRARGELWRRVRVPGCARSCLRFTAPKHQTSDDRPASRALRELPRRIGPGPPRRPRAVSPTGAYFARRAADDWAAPTAAAAERSALARSPPVEISRAREAIGWAEELRTRTAHK